MTISKNEFDEFRTLLRETKTNDGTLEKVSAFLREKTASLKFPPEKYEEVIAEIAEEVSAHNQFCNPDTLEVQTMMTIEEQHTMMTSAEIEEYHNTLEYKTWERYFEIDRMRSPDSYHIMEVFVESLPNCREKWKLGLSISGEKPFATFKSYIRRSEFLDNWYKFLEKARRCHVIANYFGKILDAEGAWPIGSNGRMGGQDEVEE